MTTPDDGSPTPGDERAERPLLIASNRLPVSVEVDDGAWRTTRSSGGLASALRGFADRGDFRWVGWPGGEVPAGSRAKLTDTLQRDGLTPVYLEAAERNGFYDVISNAVIWPLFHYFTEGLEYDRNAWADYVAVNTKFANRIAETAKPDGRVWIHDYHLMLVPRLLRRQRPDLEIGFFLHIPFPSSEVYRLLPSREELLKGVLGTDYIGFHCHDYARHFRASALRVLGLNSDLTGIDYLGRRIGIGAHPIGIDVAKFEEVLRAPDFPARLEELERRFAGRRVILGVERLDFTKGLAHKLHAFETLLDEHPELVGTVSLVQVVVPSRLDSPRYQELKSELEESVGRINGRFAMPGYTPVEYLHQSVTFPGLVGLYRFAEVCLVTPVRDGMNLVAQEFVLAQAGGTDGPFRDRGVLVLSEFAGAAQVLTSALLVNPWDVDGTVRAIRDALGMSAEERAVRMDVMAEQVRSLDCEEWARRFLRSFATSAAASRELSHATRLTGAMADSVRSRFAQAEHRVLVLDYDGTLREIARSPEDAEPTAEILELLESLIRLPRTEVHLVSGRHRRDLDQWFAGIDLALCAEHGFAWRTREGVWTTLAGLDLSWIEAAESRLRQVVREVPGTRLERKPSGVVWHYRAADPEYGEWRARELHSQLEQDFATFPVEILAGHRVVEIRAAGVNKGRYVERVLDAAPSGALALCLGDDRTDEDMYRVLGPGSVSVQVGASATEATNWVESPAHVRRFLKTLQ